MVRRQTQTDTDITDTRRHPDIHTQRLRDTHPDTYRSSDHTRGSTPTLRDRRRQVLDLHSETDMARKQRHQRKTHRLINTWRQAHIQEDTQASLKHIETLTEEPTTVILRHKHPERAFTDTHASSKRRDPDAGIYSETQSSRGGTYRDTPTEHTQKHKNTHREVAHPQAHIPRGTHAHSG